MCVHDKRAFPLVNLRLSILVQLEKLRRWEGKYFFGPSVVFVHIKIFS